VKLLLSNYFRNFSRTNEKWPNDYFSSSKCSV